MTTTTMLMSVEFSISEEPVVPTMNIYHYHKKLYSSVDLTANLVILNEQRLSSREAEAHDHSVCGEQWIGMNEVEMCL